MTSERPSLDALRIERPPIQQKKSRGWLFLTLLVLLLLGLAGYWHRSGSRAVTVKTAIAREQRSGTGNDRTLLNASGYVTPRREATVSSKVTGKVVEVLVEEGMKVKEGQALARLDDSNVRRSLELAQAQSVAIRATLEETQANLERAERDGQRTTELASGSIASASELDRALSEVKALRARLQKQIADVSVAESEVALWNQQLDDTVIRAPFSGVVVSKNAQPGEMISPMSSGGFTRTGICTIVDMTSLEIEVDVSESYINRVQEDQSVQATLDAYPEWRIPAKVVAIIPTADRQKATVKVRVGFEELDPRILPQMAAKVAFQRAESASVSAFGLTVPAAALRQSEGGPFVWLVRDGRAVKREVKVDRNSPGDPLVTSGLTGGERLVIETSAPLLEGVTVKEKQP